MPPLSFKNSLHKSTEAARRRQGGRTMDPNVFNQSQLSDVILRLYAQDSTNVDIYAHRYVLCTKSIWFEVALLGGYMEATSPVVDMRDDDVEYLKIGLEFLYTQQLPYADQTWDNLAEQFEDFVQLFWIADEYSIPTLAETCWNMFHFIADGYVCDIAAYRDGEIPRDRYRDRLAGLQSALLHTISLFYSKPVPMDPKFGLAITKIISKLEWNLSQIAIVQRLTKYPEFAVDLLADHYEGDQMSQDRICGSVAKDVRNIQAEAPSLVRSGKWPSRPRRD